ncbi:hypothetical protein EV360DRAFT_90116 [Lentinula raphanica]|nr:hypothetical protein EV360DRAFT_90116 [Lentinula raphanica]
MAISIVRRISVALLLLASVHGSMSVPLPSMPSDQNIEPWVTRNPRAVNVYLRRDAGQADEIILGVNPGQGLRYALESPPDLPPTTLSHHPTTASTSWLVTKFRALPNKKSPNTFYLGVIYTPDDDVKLELFGTFQHPESEPQGMITQPLTLEHGIEGQPTVTDIQNANMMMIDRLRNLSHLYYWITGKVVDVEFIEEENKNGQTIWEVVKSSWKPGNSGRVPIGR